MAKKNPVASQSAEPSYLRRLAVLRNSIQNLRNWIEDNDGDDIPNLEIAIDYIDREINEVILATQ
jgi:hypothetical protein